MDRIDPIPTELQCLANRLAQDAPDVINDLYTMANALSVGPFDESECGAWSATLSILAEKVRAMQFDAERLRMLVDGQTQALRDLFTKTIHMVDDLRASAAIDGGWSDSLNNAMAHVGDLQQAICDEFPGEEFPGGD